MADAPAECANCGTEIPRRARACPECGADERSGWRETDIYDGLDLPDEAWGDSESGGDDRPLARELPWYWWLAGVVALLGFLFIVLGLN
ncbi:MAG: hypothetical protein SynsKO_24980 [Synoicihabitans sp.]